MRLPLATLAVALPGLAQADTLKIVTDIAPIHSLVAQVAGDAAEVEVLVTGGASPHDFQFTVQQAGAVQDADVIIWAGARLTPWLDEALETLASDVSTVSLLAGSNWPSLDRRMDLAEFGEPHDHDHGDEDHDEHDHEDGHDEHDHSDEDHADDDHDDHDHGDHDHSAGVDPHAWLSPNVAIAWIPVIENALTEQDPDNASTYAANAARAVADLQDLDTELAEMMAPYAGATLLVPHDAYQYFGTRYDVVASGAISLSDATAPTPDHLAELQEFVAEQNITCVLTDPQSRSEWVDLVREGTSAKTALADPLGAEFPLGPDHYAQTLRAAAAAYVACLGD